MTMPQIPQTIDELTPRWLTGALRSRGNLGTGSVVSSEATLLSDGKSVGFLGIVARLALVYDGPCDAAPPSLIVKLPSLDPAIREVTRPLHIYEREVRFYERAASDPGLPVPRCWYGDMDLDADRFILLIEDMAPGRAGDQLAGCTAEDARRVVLALARFHASWWQHADLPAFDWLFPVNDERQKSLQQRFQEAWPKFLEQWRDLLSPEVVDIGEAYFRSMDWLLDRIFEMPHTIQHADLRLDNLLFGSDGLGSDVTIIDWQAPTCGGGMLDVGYFLSQSLAVDVRRAHEQELVRLYYDSLLQHGVHDYSWDQAFRDYRMGALWGLLLPVWGTGNLDLTNDRALSLFEALVIRCSAALLDLNARELLPA
jgi:hypothetical protein